MGRQSLQAQLDALQADGLPITIADLDAYYAIPAGEVDSTEEWMAAFTSVDQPKFQQGVQDFPFLGEAEEPMFEEEWVGQEEASEFLSGCEEELALIYAAAQKGGRLRYPVQFTGPAVNFQPYFQSSRQVSRLLTLSAYINARSGNCAETVQDIQALLALSNTLQGEVTMISYLVGIAIHSSAIDLLEQVMPVCHLTSENIELLQQLNRVADFKNSMKHVLVGERAFVLTALDMFPAVPLRVANKKVALAYYEDALNNIDGSWSEILANQKKISDGYKKKYSGVISRLQATGVNMSSGAHVSFLVANTRATAQQRCLNIVFALKRMQSAGEMLPAKVTDIPVRYLTSAKELGNLLIDPFDGKPLRMLTEDGRILIYSVGENLVDDGGDCSHEENTTGLDIGFWLPTE